MTRLMLLSGLPVLGLLACTQKTTTVETPYPDLVVSSDLLEFGQMERGQTSQRSFTITNNGGMPMGIGAIEFGDGMSENFTVSYTPSTIECPAGATDTGATAKDFEIDSGGPPQGGDSGGGGGENGGGENGGGGEDTGGDTGTSGDGRALFTLDPGCHINVTVTFNPQTIGDIWGALMVESIQAELTAEEEEAGDLPVYLRDPVAWRQWVYLYGSADASQGILVVKPRSYDFGYVDPAETEPAVAHIDISNVGDDDLTLLDAVLATGCDTAFTRDYSFEPGKILQPGETSLVEISFKPTDTDGAYCSLEISSDDPVNPLLDVSISGNSSDDPDNQPPTVYIRSPEVGYRYTGGQPLIMELNVFDVNQPATTLTCKIKSAVVQETSLATCTPTDESGHVFVEIPGESLESGVDTLLVSVTDAAETTAYASVAVVINVNYPAGDDDGDGFDETTEPADCDDTDGNTYPEAAEIYDLLDNDCDTIVDEETFGYDDDGDSLSEAAGDCNDYNEDTYPGGPELGDGADNDCDGLVDEATSLYDDDGDGYAEVNNDCDDDDAAINPTAVEVCDGLDNDCDGIKDSGDDCISTDSLPQIIGKVKPSQMACLSGETITLSAKVFDADGQTPTYSWSDDANNGTAYFDNPTAPTVTWTCPELDSDSGGRKYNVYVIVYDPDNNQDWSVEEVSVYPADYDDLYLPYTEVVAAESSGLCSTANVQGAVASVSLAGLGLLLARRRVRQG